MKNLRKQILTLAEAESQIKLPAGFKKPADWDSADEKVKKEYLNELKKYEDFMNGGWKSDSITIPQLISQLQQAYRKYGDIRISYNDPDEGYVLVDKVLFDKKHNRLVISCGEYDYDDAPQW